MLKNKPNLELLRSKDFLAILVSVCACIYLILPNSTDQVSSTPMTKESLDTKIPYGYQLVPIEIANIHSLKSMVGDQITVDLFAKQGATKNHKLVLQNVRLLQAPLDPTQFGALLLAHQTKSLLNATGPYYATINPFQRKGPLKPIAPKKIRTTKRQITYSEEER